MDIIKELQWRGMVHDYMPGTDELLKNESVTFYLGIDPTADSLHIGHLASVMLLRHFQLAGHKPIVLSGGATGMIGDPSGKSQERNLLDINTIRDNQQKIKAQLENIIDFNDKKTGAELVNNYNWMSQFSFLDFFRDIGKHITINYMMAKDSVKKRLETGISFTEFSYQLVQGYDFYYLYKNRNCKLQVGGADQWGNITTGTELIRRKDGGEAYALTCPLITKSDGGKFGKTEEGNIWLNPEYTTPYKFYQFWLNVSDEDAKKYIKVFTLLSKKDIEALIKEHDQAPHQRMLQKELAKQTTIMVRTVEKYNTTIEASSILFGKGTIDSLKKIDEKTFLQIFEGVSQYVIDKNVIKDNIDILELLCDNSSIFDSRGEARRMIKGGGLKINKTPVNSENLKIGLHDLINNKYILIQKGKKKYFLIKIK